MNRIVAEDLIAPGLQKDSVYRERFNLSHEDVVIVARSAGKPHITYNFAKSWSNYVRATLVRKNFHCFSGLDNDAAASIFISWSTTPWRVWRKSAMTTRQLLLWRCAI